MATPAKSDEKARRFAPTRGGQHAAAKADYPASIRRNPKRENIHSNIIKMNDRKPPGGNGCGFSLSSVMVRFLLDFLIGLATPLATLANGAHASLIA
jgi:hypothetical protein